MPKLLWTYDEGGWVALGLTREGRDDLGFTTVHPRRVRVGIPADRLDENPTSILDAQSRRQAG